MNKIKRSEAKHKILFLIPAGKVAPSGVRRALDYIPYLQNHNWQNTVVSHRSSFLLLVLHKGSWLKREVSKVVRSRSASAYFLIPLLPLIVLLAVIARRLVDLIALTYSTSMLLYVLLRARFVHIIFIQQVTPPIWFTTILGLLNSNIVYDIDDAVFLNQPERAVAIAKTAAVATPGSHYNADFCGRNCRKSIFLPTPVPIDRFEVVSRPACKQGNGPFRIGWVGSLDTVKYLDIVMEPLSRLGRTYPGQIVLVVVGLGKRQDLVPNVNGVLVEAIPWVPPERVPEIVTTFDTGIMPLHETEWEKGKCGLKALEYMAAGIPAVCSAVGENNYIIHDGVNGFLAKTAGDWEEKIEKLVLSLELRVQIGRAGHETINQRYSTRVCFNILFHQVLEPLTVERNG